MPDDADQVQLVEEIQEKVRHEAKRDVGAGAGGRNAIGTAVLGGMAASTVLGIFLVPVFFLLVRSWFKSRSRHDDAQEHAA